jgi:hypothetical protein
MMAGSESMCLIAAPVPFFVMVIDLPDYRRMAREEL